FCLCNRLCSGLFRVPCQGWFAGGGAIQHGSRSLDFGDFDYFELGAYANDFELMIEIRDLKKSCDEAEVLKGISTVFETGKTNLIIGQSGSGKTVLLKCLSGLIRPTSGEVLFDGQDTTQYSFEERQALRGEIGTVFQGSALFDSMTVLENVRFPLEMFS